jgi:hypothetical protein
MRKIKTVILLAAVSLILFCCVKSENTSTSDEPRSASFINVSNLEAPSLMLHVRGNKIFNDKGEEVRLVGVNICSLEWNSRGDDVVSSTYEVFANWNCNVVRLPLSQDRWFGKVSDWSTPNPPDGGEQYRDIVNSVVELALIFGKYIIIDLHWSNAGAWGQNIGQRFMPDYNSLEFWIDVASKYSNHPAVLFNLYNEPHSVSWEVWRNGGTVTEVVNSGTADEIILVYDTPGHQKLVNEIRALGANNIIIAGGLDWAYDLRGIAEGYALADTPEGNGIVYDSHIYPWKEWDGVNHDTRVLCIKDDFPIIIGEFGIDPDGEWGAARRPFWLNGLLDWMDDNELHWVGWCFHRDATPNMISDWDFTPTVHHGAILKERLLSYSDTNAHLNELPKKP